ncbi:hypothetical protein IQ07DRAFT_20034, partial [Pyrenochaeta sp. DS3sAY3a]
QIHPTGRLLEDSPTLYKGGPALFLLAPTPLEYNPSILISTTSSITSTTSSNSSTTMALDVMPRSLDPELPASMQSPAAAAPTRLAPALDNAPSSGAGAPMGFTPQLSVRDGVVSQEGDNAMLNFLRRYRAVADDACTLLEKFDIQMRILDDLTSQLEEMVANSRS